MVMDFLDRLKDKINELTPDDISCRIGYLGVGESLVVNPLPGSRVVQTYMNGATDQQLNFEIAMQSLDMELIHNTLWSIQSKLETISDVESTDNSFVFQDLIITNKPFINRIDEQGWFVFLLDVQANITVFKEEKING